MDDTKKYSKEQRKAIKVFADYISCEQPYQEIPRRTYKKLGELYKQLPEEVFSVPKCNSFYHLSIGSRKSEKLTDSGIVSCTTPEGKTYISSTWFIRNGDIWWRLKKCKAVDVRKLYDVAYNIGVLEESGWLTLRIYREDEYILPLEKVSVLSKRVIRKKN